MGLCSQSGKTSYSKISWSLEAARFRLKLSQSLWNLRGSTAAAVLRCISNFRTIHKLKHPISQIWDFTRFGDKTCYRLVNRVPWHLQARWWSSLGPVYLCDSIIKRSEWFIFSIYLRDRIKTVIIRVEPLLVCYLASGIYIFTVALPVDQFIFKHQNIYHTVIHVDIFSYSIGFDTLINTDKFWPHAWHQ